MDAPLAPVVVLEDSVRIPDLLEDHCLGRANLLGRMSVLVRVVAQGTFPIGFLQEEVLTQALALMASSSADQVIWDGR